LTETVVVEPVLLDGAILERDLAVLGERQTREGCAFVTADKKSKPGSPQHWARPVLVEIDFAEARRLLLCFDRRQVPDDHKALKAEALERGWWVPKGLNDEWLLNKGWEDYYERKRLEDEAKPPQTPQSLTELIQTDVDRRLIAAAQDWGIKAPLVDQLTDEWRLHIINILRARVAAVAIRDLEDRIFKPQPPKRRGKPEGAWNKKLLKREELLGVEATGTKAVVNRRNRRRAKTKY
jgi:hypothetical protein